MKAEEILKYLPSVEKPTFRQTFNQRLKWTGIALILYLILTQIIVYGVEPASYAQFRFFEIVLGSRFGSLMTLGIGPIVTASIILQLLVGSKILNWDTTKEEGRKKFQAWSKILAIIFAFVEAFAFVLSGFLPIKGVELIPIVALQLAMGGIIVIILDELVSKWGFGSGVSLFIAAGVTTSILVQALSPLAICVEGLRTFGCLPSPNNPPVGLIWRFFGSLIELNLFNALVNILPIISTIIIFLVVAYLQNVRVEIPLAFSYLRGFGRAWSLRLFYTSNIPVIFAAALLSYIQLMSRVGVSEQDGLMCSLMGCFDANGNPVSGVIYYLSAPTNFLQQIFTGTLIPSEFFRALTYTLFLVTFATLFSVFWVNTAGMDAKTIAKQLESAGMQIPGFRRDPRITESVLNRYIPYLAVLGGMLIGLLAAVADFTNALGTGTGILLTSMILFNYYEILKTQRIEEAHPLIRKIIGE